MTRKNVSKSKRYFSYSLIVKIIRLSNLKYINFTLFLPKKPYLTFLKTESDNDVKKLKLFNHAINNFLNHFNYSNKKAFVFLD
jgi:hypothetical protein